MDRCFLGIHSIIFYSSLLDQRIPEALNWMFNSASDITNSILALTKSTGPRTSGWMLNSCLTMYNCPSYIITHSKRKISSQAVIKTILLKLINILIRVFANGPGDLGSIPGRVIPKTLKMKLDTTLLNTQHYKVRFKGKVEQSREWSSALPYTLV